MKYSFSIMALDTLDPVTKLFFEIQNATGLLTYFIIFLPCIVLFWNYIRKSQDIGASGVKVLHVLFVLTITMYYWGVVGGYESITGKQFVHVAFLFFVAILYVGVVAGLKFFRSSPT